LDRTDHIPEHAVAPGEQVPAVGAQRVVWWDPSLLALRRPTTGGLLQQELLRADEQGERDAEGVRAHQTWLDTRASLIERAAAPGIVARAMTAVAHDPSTQLDAIAHELIDSGADRSLRPRGPRFGSLVHALLASASLEDDVEELERLAALIGRSLLATPDEMRCAVSAVRSALAHPLFENVRRAKLRQELFRETPVVLRARDGSVLDGVVDLAFRDRSQMPAQIVLIDFKTDAELQDVNVYARQLGMYAEALARVFDEPVRSLLFRV
jgi:ATP-dependent exoDNAse (exonuclease V) beta subunit